MDSSSNTIFLNNGTGVFGVETTYSADGSPDTVLTLDMNGDGCPFSLQVTYNTGSTVLVAHTQLISMVIIDPMLSPPTMVSAKRLSLSKICDGC